MTTKGKKQALGRGLNAILQSPDTDITSRDISGNYVVGAIAELPLSSIEANPFQPRDRFEEEALNDLAESIKHQGIIQPVTVRKMGYDRYQLISGERRLKAAKIAGLEKIPAFIRVANDQQMLEMALVENIQRENLNPIEVAISYQRLIEECHITQETLSDKVGKNRSTVTNYLRLLKLEPEIQKALQDEQITMGHARALLGIEQSEPRMQLFNATLLENLSVREVENRAREIKTTRKSPERKTITPLPPRHKEAKSQLTEHFNTKINIKRDSKGKGFITLHFNNDTDFERLLNRMHE
ncbi:MAG: ParB/RepB/Spo0J family partition protein [Bacteroidales bacterium]|nr:ParB/RepB/Spo0J family partition protein [Bacteroidales bacterium]MDD2322864.1 ParB/RepB/Spo0J family partition protein [Bacteroidales bacterium]MDD3011391.1 ParB/RepB/Spo0J family partition protein [Bacteroidales bacterium]MDY0285091.1 ParB/RepB/Spo0J family partition protein [Bacteroidales bacterium]